MGAASSQADTKITDVPSLQDIEETLSAILASLQFRNSLQCSNFLRYVVRHSLSGEDHLLRERVIGHEVFHRAADYETGEDPVVRIRAAEVRKRLAQYYQSASSGVQIEVPSGSYRALFHRRPSTATGASSTSVFAPEAVASSVALPTAQPLIDQAELSAHGSLVSSDAALAPTTATFLPTPEALLADRPAPFETRRPRMWWIAAVVASATLAAGVTYVSTTNTPKNDRAERQFWGPWLDVHHPVLIAMGSNAVYRLPDTVANQYANAQGLQTQGLEVFPPAQALANLHGSDFTPAENSFVALGDVAAVTNLVAVLARHGQHFAERFPNDISFAELRGSPTILVGGYNNSTSAEMTKALRFRLMRHNEIDDMQNHERTWELHASLDSHETEDYAILTRTLQQGTDAPMLSVAGMGQYGTQSAAEFIASPTSLAGLDSVLGKGWQDKNVQLVLHVKVHDFKPSRPEIVASYTW